MEQDAGQTWRPLRLFNLYRMLLAGLLLIIGAADLDFKPIGQNNPGLYFSVTGIYFLICIANAFTIAWKRPNFTTQVYLHVLIDIAAITLIMHASGGVQSGLGMLMVVTVAGGSILLAGQAAIRLAAAATLAMLGEHVYYQLTNPLESSAYTHAGLLGATFFATAILTHALAKKVRASEALARQRGIDLANMEQLAQYVIQRMQTGVVVIDVDDNVRLINESARQLLNTPPLTEKQPLTTLCPQLADQLHLWQKEQQQPSRQFRATSAVAEVLPRFARLGEDGGTLIFLEDTTALAQQAQQLKLASLGKLAGSIAHEIRNPLGAISHAGQLLAESPNIDSTDLRLTEIIRTNSQRMNSIIENVLQLGRRRQPAPESIELKPWLEQFIEEFYRSEQLKPDNTAITIEVEPEEITISFDSNQLNQVLWNLCHNGIHHGNEHTKQSRLTLRAGHLPDNPTPWLEIIDNGPGIAEEAVEHIFEPFFTTDTQGTGLGLYIAKELCECNHAHLTYNPIETGGSCFRITFADPRRQRGDQ